MAGCSTCGNSKIRAYLNKKPIGGVTKILHNQNNEPLIPEGKKVIYKRVNGRLVTEIVDK